MTFVRYDSSRDMAALQQGLGRMLEGFYRRPQEDLNRGAWVPVVDIYSNGQHELVLKAELPDMKEEIGLTVEDNHAHAEWRKEARHGGHRGALPSHRAQLWRVRADVRAAADGRRFQDQRSVQGRCADRPAAAA